MASAYPNPPDDRPPEYIPPGGPVPYSTPMSPPNNTMAIVSLVSGILGLTFIPFLGSIVAVITGTMARREIRESAGAYGGDGLAVAGLIMGWIGIALGVLGLCIGGVAILLPFCFLSFGPVFEEFNHLILPVALALF